MPPKRKTEAAAEPSPPTKSRRSAKEKVEKKRPRETDEQDAATRARRSKKKLSGDDESEAPAPIVVVTPRKRVTKAKSPVSPVQSSPVAAAPKSSMKSATKARPSSRKSIGVRIELPIEPRSAERPRSAPVTPRPSSPSSSPAPPRVAVSPKRVTKSVIAEQPQEASDDSHEMVSVWNQVWGSLMISLKTLGPAFLIIILSCYFLGTLQQSQAIATVGVVYTLLFLTIMGSYAVVILPCILIARVFTSIVSPHATAHSTEEVNLYSRLLVLILAAAGLGYYFFQTAFVN